MNDKRGVTSSALWDSLKTTCLHMQRVDLAGMCERQDLEGENRFRIEFMGLEVDVYVLEFRNSFEY
jgi:peroxin-5